MRGSDRQLYALIAADWEFQKQQSPALAQFSGDRRWMNSWPDLRRSRVGALAKKDRERLAALRRIDANSLSQPAKLDYRLFERELVNRQEEVAVKAYLSHFWQFERFGPIDTGIHAKGWSRDQAVRYFVEQTGKAIPIAESEIQRAIWDPGSLVAYKTGELIFKGMRSRANATLGRKFDVRDFHEFLLREGSLPLDILQSEFDEWLDGHPKNKVAESAR